MHENYKRRRPGRDNSEKEQTAGVMQNWTAGLHRNMFAIGLLGRKSAQVTSENAILNLHMDVKKGETNEQGSDRNEQSDQHCFFRLPFGGLKSGILSQNASG